MVINWEFTQVSTDTLAIACLKMAYLIDYVSIMDDILVNLGIQI